jgi:hypothetical protein
VSEQREVTLEFIAEQQHRILSEIRILRNDVDVLSASMRRIDNRYDQLRTRMETGFDADQRDARNPRRAPRYARPAGPVGCPRPQLEEERQ